jgi:hypothetical protein
MRSGVPDTAGPITVAEPAAKSRSTEALRLVRSPTYPGTLLYHEWAKLLRDGKITYAEFIDWITPERPHRPRWKALMQRLIGR